MGIALILPGKAEAKAQHERGRLTRASGVPLCTMSPALLIALFIVIAILLVVGAYYAHKRLIELWQRTAAGLGFQYAEEDPFNLVSIPFRLFKLGEGQGCENVVWGTRNGLDVKAFDFWYYEDSTDGEGHTSRSYERFSCAVVPAPVGCPPTSIGPESFGSRIGRALGFHDIEFESEDFNKKMKVKSAEPKFANYLIDARMMQWLLDNKGWEFELTGMSMLAYCRKVKPPQIVKVIEAVEGFRQHIPNVVEETYKEGS